MNHRERALGLVRRMTPREKAAQLYSAWLKIDADGSFAFRSVNDGFIRDAREDPREVLRDGIGQVTRPLGTRPAEARSVVRGLNALQKFLVEKTRLGIPALAHEECLPGLMAKGATQFPAAINLGSLWDEEAVREAAAVIGRELHGVGSRQGLAPVLDVCRDARWGRVEETFGEDPYLVGCAGAAYVKGLQGEDRRVLATLKHYAGHSFSEGGRNHAPVHVGERELADVFLLPFEMAVSLAGAGSVMPAYHDIDGEPSSASRKLLTEVLRERWGFDGIVVSDYEAVRLLAAHHGVARDEAEASALALRAGMDVELPGFTCFRAGILQALDRGLLSMGTLDAAVERVLVEKSRLGLFERPYADEDGIVLNTPEHRAAAARAAARSLVLLKNDGTLPLRDQGVTALVGPLADDPLALFCGYSFPVHLLAARQEDPGQRPAQTLREALAARAKTGSLVYAEGCRILSERRKEPPVFPEDAGAARGQTRSYVSLDEGGIEEAVQAARKADRLIAAVGDLSGLFLTGTVGEGSDASSLVLPGVQQKLLEALLDTGKPLVVVLLNGRPYNLGRVYEGAAAVLEAWLPGQEGAGAIADALYGAVNPGGRLTVSIPKSAGAMPFFYNHRLKAAGTPVQPEFGAVYPFGHGLSYTSFDYSGFRLAAAEVPVDGTVEAACEVRNSGHREGEEVVQLYVRDVQARFVRPVIELKGFRRLALAPGQKKTVRFSLPVDLLCYSADGLRRVVEPGAFEVMIGRSCEQILFRSTVTVTGAERELPRGWRMRTESRVE